MDYDVSQDGERFVVDAIDFDGDGEIYTALFIGPDAEQRANEYAEWKNKK